ncbi:MAG: DCC1-like thiol-disulfide oxidoreductase family protein [Candidatus Velthaea sp.]
MVAARDADTRRLIYDGECGMCGRLARYAGARLSGWDVVAFQALPDERLAELGLTRADCAHSVQVASARTRPLSGARAVNAVLIAMQHPLAVAARAAEAWPPLLALEERGYRFVAANRPFFARFVPRD